MVLRVRSTVGNVLLVLGVVLLAVAAAGYAVEAFVTGEAVGVGVVALVLLGVGANVKRGGGSAVGPSEDSPEESSGESTDEASGESPEEPTEEAS